MARNKKAHIQCTNLQATDTNQESEEFQKGFNYGWWHQPEIPDASEDFKRGYKDGWNTKSLDSN